MLGNALLVAPIFKESGEVDYYLPKGKWINLITGEKKDGGSWQLEVHPRHPQRICAMEAAMGA